MSVRAALLSPPVRRGASHGRHPACGQRVLLAHQINGNEAPVFSQFRLEQLERLHQRVGPLGLQRMRMILCDSGKRPKTLERLVAR